MKALKTQGNCEILKIVDGKSNCPICGARIRCRAQDGASRVSFYCKRCKHVCTLDVETGDI